MQAPEDDGRDSEPSFELGLHQLLDDETLSDVTLQGTDGVKVLAIRSMLAVRSPVFRRMLFGEFSESESPIVKIGYTGKVLTFLVKYCVTGESDLSIGNCVKRSYPKFVLSTADAARYFELPNLMRTLLDDALEFMNESPKSACLFLQASREDLHGFENIEEKSLELIRNDPDTTLLKAKATLLIKATLLEEILKDTTLQTDEYTLFLVVKAWAEVKSPPIEDNEEGKESRREVASRLVKNYISLDLISPSNLCNIVGPSGLSETTELNAAYKEQALLAEAVTNKDYAKNVRSNRVHWKSSKSDVFASSSEMHCVETLERRVMKAGIHQWRIKVKEECNSVWLGVASISHDVSEFDWLGKQQGGWAYGSNSSAWHANKHPGSAMNTFPTFSKGSIVTFHLNLPAVKLSQDAPEACFLSQDALGGTLHASVDGGSFFVLFTNMVAAFEKGKKVGFVPAVSLMTPGRVRFLGFQNASKEMRLLGLNPPAPFRTHRPLIYL
eukprot:scaffold171037_cov51-Attheya_sp.AAC.2